MGSGGEDVVEAVLFALIMVSIDRVSMEQHYPHIF
jgi:hypothetical protein